MKTINTLAAAAVITSVICGGTSTSHAQEGSGAYLGDLMTIGFNFCPRDWAAADGQLLSIYTYQSLYSLLGTTFGGDGKTTFALPDLRGRSSVGTGTIPQNPPIPPITVIWGEKGGAASFTSSIDNMPTHTHSATSQLNSISTTGTTFAPEDNLLASGWNIYSGTGTTQRAHAGSVSTVVNNAGSQAVVHKRSPFLGLYTCIAIQGQFPPRN